MEPSPEILEAFDSDDETLRCVDFIDPGYRLISIMPAFNPRETVEGVAWALQWGFSNTLAQFEAQDLSMLKQSAAQYAALPEPARAPARDCKDRVQAILTDTTREGFSTTAVAWSMIGAISNLTRQMLAAHMTPRHARRQHEKIVKTMIAALKKARRMGEAENQPCDRRQATVH